VRWSYSPYSSFGGCLGVFCSLIFSCRAWFNLWGASFGWALTKRCGSSWSWYTNGFSRLYSPVGANVFLGSHGDYKSCVHIASSRW